MNTLMIISEHMRLSSSQFPRVTRAMIPVPLSQQKPKKNFKRTDLTLFFFRPYGLMIM